ncbi:hypothetical protein ACLOJK_027073, partial [Asimina triloba]
TTVCPLALGTSSSGAVCEKDIVLAINDLSVLSHQEETGLYTTVAVAGGGDGHCPSLAPHGTSRNVALDAEGPVTRAEHAPVGTFDHPDAVAPCGTSSGSKCTSAVRGLPSDWGGTALRPRR